MEIGTLHFCWFLAYEWLKNMSFFMISTWNVKSSLNKWFLKAKKTELIILSKKFSLKLFDVALPKLRLDYKQCKTWS